MFDKKNENLKKLIVKVEELLKKMEIKSVNPYDSVKVYSTPKPWILLGTGNYAAVVYHPEFEDLAVKIYAEGRPGIDQEIKVYQKLGSHPAYSQCYYHGENYLILKRLKGINLYDCLRKGIKINEQVIMDIDNALDYARKQGLYPHDVHVKNVMMLDGRGIVADVSDFNKKEYCSMWKHIKKAYYKIYRKSLYKVPMSIPRIFLELVRKGYRIYSRLDKVKLESDRVSNPHDYWWDTEILWFSVNSYN